MELVRSLPSSIRSLLRPLQTRYREYKKYKSAANIRNNTGRAVVLKRKPRLPGASYTSRITRVMFLAGTIVSMLRVLLLYIHSAQQTKLIANGRLPTEEYIRSSQLTQAVAAAVLVMAWTLGTKATGSWSEATWVSKLKAAKTYEQRHALVMSIPTSLQRRISKIMAAAMRGDDSGHAFVETTLGVPQEDIVALGRAVLEQNLESHTYILAPVTGITKTVLKRLNSKSLKKALTALMLASLIVGGHAPKSHQSLLQHFNPLQSNLDNWTSLRAPVTNSNLHLLGQVRGRRLNANDIKRLGFDPRGSEKWNKHDFDTDMVNLPGFLGAKAWSWSPLANAIDARFREAERFNLRKNPSPNKHTWNTLPEGNEKVIQSVLMKSRQGMLFQRTLHHIVQEYALAAEGLNLCRSGVIHATSPGQRASRLWYGRGFAFLIDVDKAFESDSVRHISYTNSKSASVPLLHHCGRSPGYNIKDGKGPVENKKNQFTIAQRHALNDMSYGYAEVKVDINAHNVVGMVLTYDIDPNEVRDVIASTDAVAAHYGIPNALRNVFVIDPETQTLIPLRSLTQYKQLSNLNRERKKKKYG